MGGKKTNRLIWWGMKACGFDITRQAAGECVTYNLSSFLHFVTAGLHWWVFGFEMFWSVLLYNARSANAEKVKSNFISAVISTQLVSNNVETIQREH